MSKIHRIDQGSHDWYKLRLGIPTSSMFHKILTPGGKVSSQSRGYMYRLIAERLLQDTMDDQPHVEWMEHGKLMQPNAAAQFQLVQNVQLAPGGFVTTDDSRMGCSPDYLIFGSGVPQSVEVKCPAPWTQIGYLLDGPGNDYRPQVQGQLFVSGWELAHFYSYREDMPACHRETTRDEKYLLLMRDALEEFCDELDEETERARKLGAYVVQTRIATPLEQHYEELGGPDFEIKLP